MSSVFLVVWALYTGRQTCTKLPQANAEWQVASAEVFCLELLTRVITHGYFRQQVWRSHIHSKYENIRLRKSAYKNELSSTTTQSASAAYGTMRISSIALARSFSSSLFFINFAFPTKKTAQMWNSGVLSLSWFTLGNHLLVVTCWSATDETGGADEAIAVLLTIGESPAKNPPSQCANTDLRLESKTPD